MPDTPGSLLANGFSRTEALWQRTAKLLRSLLLSSPNLNGHSHVGRNFSVSSHDVSVGIGCNRYNCHRPHQAPRGRTPLEVANTLAPARDGPRFEPRPAVNVEAHNLRTDQGAALECVVDFQLRRHLPVVTLRHVA